MRHKDVGWDLPTKMASWDQVIVAVLMDLRDQLQQLNRTLSCPNFLSIPAKLDLNNVLARQIRANTSKRRKKR